MRKLDLLVEAEGFSDSEELLETFITNEVVPGICKNPGCDYTAQVEPDSRSGYCEVCDTQSVVSCLVLAGVI